MANPNGNNNPNIRPKKEEIIDQVETLWPVPSVCFNIPGLFPTSVTYNIKKKDLENCILEMIRAFSPDFALVKFEIDVRTGQISLWAWIRKDSPDIMDNRMKDRNDLIINSGMGMMGHFSPRLKKLRDELGVKPSGGKDVNGDPSSDGSIYNRFNLVRPTNSNSPYFGLQLDILKTLDEMFDSSDDYYEKMYRAAFPTKIYQKSAYIVNLTPIVDSRHERCESFTITKTLCRPNRLEDLHPKTPHRISGD